LKINVYDKNKIKKTYETDAYSLMLGTIEDFLEVVNINDFINLSSENITAILSKSIANSLPFFKSLLKDVFDGITDDELKNVKIVEIVQVVIDIMTYAFNELSIGNKSKN